MKAFEVRKNPTQYFQKNTMLPFVLPLNGKIGVIYITLSGQVVISGGTANGTAQGEGGPYNLIRRVILRANPANGSRYPGGEIVNCTSRGLMRRGITQYRKLIPDLNGTTLGNGAAGTYQVATVIPIYFADPNVARQWQTALNADPAAYQTLQLEVVTGDLANCFAGNDRNIDVSQLQVRVSDERHAFAGDTYCLFQEDHHTYIPQSKQDFVDGGLPSSGAFLDFLVMTLGTNAAFSDAILNRVKINGPSIHYEIEAQDIRAKMFMGNWYDAAQVATGQYLIDLIDGNNLAAVNANGLSVQFDVNAPDGANVDDLLIFTRRIFQPANMNAQAMPEYAGK